MAPKPKKRLKGKDRKAQIVDVALQLFSEKGFSGTRTKEIARRAGISEALVFRHFRSKEQLYNEALKSTLEGHPIISDMIGKMEQKDDYGVLSSYAAHMVKYGLKDERMFRLILYSGLEGVPLIDHSCHHQEGEDEESWEPEDIALIRYFEQRIRDGAFKGHNPEVVARHFRNAVVMYVMDNILKIDPHPFPVSHSEAIVTLVRIFLNGLKE